MTRIFCTTFLLACAAAGIGCGTDQAVEPYPQDPWLPREQPVFKSLWVSPGAFEMNPGATTQLQAFASNTWGLHWDVTGPVAYSTKAPEIATVSDEGHVTGVTPGITSISATVTIGAVTRTTWMTAYVRDTVPSDEVVLASGSDGWQPSVAHVKAGGIVRWLTGQTNGRGDPSPTLRLINEGHPMDSLDLSSGTATRRFNTPGEIRYCAGGCWDPADFGTIYIH